MQKTLSLLALLSAILLVTACQSAQSPTANVTPPSNQISSPPALSAADVAAGKVIYTNNCASCHGVNLEGQANWKQQNEDGSFRAPPHTVDGHTWHHSDANLIAAITEGGARFEGLNVGGTSNMPAYGSILTDEEVVAVLAYIKSTWPDEIRAVQWQQTSQNPSP
jgi:mono/diheme cytochrome c family protein